jgi:hypothetical protein
MFVAGLFAGMTGYFCATPLLQVKTQMQVEAGKLGPEGLYVTGARKGQAGGLLSTRLRIIPNVRRFWDAHPSWADGTSSCFL